MSNVSTSTKVANLPNTPAKVSVKVWAGNAGIGAYTLRLWCGSIIKQEWKGTFSVGATSYNLGEANSLKGACKTELLSTLTQAGDIMSWSVFENIMVVGQPDQQFTDKGTYKSSADTITDQIILSLE